MSAKSPPARASCSLALARSRSVLLPASWSCLAAHRGRGSGVGNALAQFHQLFGSLVRIKSRFGFGSESENVARDPRLYLLELRLG